MAESTITWNSFYYADALQVYDKNGNTQTSVIGNGRYIGDDVPGQERGAYLTDMMHYTFDFTGDVDHKNTYTLFEYANGVKIKLDCWNVGGSGNFTAYYENIDGAHITGINDFNGACLMIPGYTQLDSIEYYFNPYIINYDSEQESKFPNPDSIAIYSLWQTKPQPDFPHVDGFMEYEDIDRHFYVTTGPQLTNDEELQAYLEALKNGGDGSPIIPIDPEDDTSTTGGGDGDYNPFSDPIGHPTLPIGGDAISTGFVRVYQPSTGQLRALASKLWSDDFINTIKKIQNDPMEAIISLHSIPFSMPTVSGNCVVGNYDSHVAMPVVLSQFVSKSLGSIRIPEHWGSALDYSPYVVVDCFIPFIGVRSLQVDDAIGKSLSINANVDILTGATIVTVMCGNSVLYAWNTNVIVKHPITMSSMGPLYQSILGMAGNVINGAVSGGIGGAVGGGLGSAVNVAMSKHSQISRGGAIAGNAGALGHFTPYLILHRPKQSLASGFAHFKGYPSNITASIGSVTGYSEIESVHLTGIPCTDAERDEIQTLLYNGVIL